MKKQKQNFAIGILTFLTISASAVTHYVDVNSANPVSPYLDWSTAAATIQDAVDAADAGDLVLVTNGVYQAGGRAVYGSSTNRVAVMKPLTLQSVNGSGVTIIIGYQIPGQTNGETAIRGVYLTNGAVLSGFSIINGATSTNTGVYQARHGGGIYCETRNVFVSDCLLQYNSAVEVGGGVFSGTLSNCTIRGNSASGGGGAANSVLLNCTIEENSAGGGGGTFYSWMTNCTLQHNLVWYGGGGGALMGTLDNCLVLSNSAYSSGGGSEDCLLVRCSVIGNSTITGMGGGANGGQLNYCTISNNISQDAGGGVLNAKLSQCIVICNTANYGGGAFGCGLFNSVVCSNSAAYSGGGCEFSSSYNSIIYHNTAQSNPNYSPGSMFYYSCTTPLPSYSPGCFTNDPMFVDLAEGDFRLQSDSPCINAGLNTFLTNALLTFTNNFDFDHNQRIVADTVDIGPYEFENPSSVLSYEWAQRNGIATDGSEDSLDADGDGADNKEEWLAGTDPADSQSFFRMLMPTNSAEGVVLQWTSTNSQMYWLEISTNLAMQPAFSTMVGFISDQGGVATFLDTNNYGGLPVSYRAGSQRWWW